MNLEKYPLKMSQNKRRYDFISKGPMGNIKKVVEFQELSQNLFNLAFGDWDRKNRKIDTRTRSNNGDRDKILATVAHAVFEFFNFLKMQLYRLKDKQKLERGYTRWG